MAGNPYREAAAGTYHFNEYGSRGGEDVKKNTWDYAALALIVVVGISLAFLVSAFLDALAFQNSHQNFVLDEEGNWVPDQFRVEEYRVQAIEAHILGTGVGLIVTVTLLALWLDRRRKR